MSHMLYGKNRLCYTEVTEFTDFQGIGKDPLYKRYDSVYAVVERNIEPQYRDFLAHPVYSDDQDQILWYVREWNESPVAYNDLPEGNKYVTIKEHTIAEYQRVCDNLSGEDKQILMGALRHLDEDFMYCYDNKVVVVAWGMVPDSHRHVVKGAVIHDLKIPQRYTIRFLVGENGVLINSLQSSISKSEGTILSMNDLPVVKPNEGYVFKGWSPDPIGQKVTGPLEFCAEYDEVEVVKVCFTCKYGGYIEGRTTLTLNKGARMSESDVPSVIVEPGYSFVGWNKPIDALIDSDTEYSAIVQQNDVTCVFEAGEHGRLQGEHKFVLLPGTDLDGITIPRVIAKKGYKFVGWDKPMANCTLDEDTVFTAQYEKTMSWYKRMWAWFKGNGCLKWLLWILLAILLMWLLVSSLKGCDVGNSAFVDTVGRIIGGIGGGGDDGSDGVDKPGDDIPTGDDTPPNGDDTPPNGDDGYSGYETPNEWGDGDNYDSYPSIIDDNGRLPKGDIIVTPIIDEDGKLPPIIDGVDGNKVIANRLNIFFKNNDVDIDQFVADLSRKYSSKDCKVIGVNKLIPMIQILVRVEQRDVIRECLEQELPNYDFIVVDEAIMSSMGRQDKNSSLSIGWHLNAINVQEGWKITKGSSDVIVAVVDDGLDVEHEMFKGRIVSPYNITTQNRQLGVGSGHGTHVAGLAVGSDKIKTKGVAGVAPQCKLMPIQVFAAGSDGASFTDVIAGIVYAINNGASVVNVSIGMDGMEQFGNLPISEQQQLSEGIFEPSEQVWRRVIDIANERNVILLFAAGNDTILARLDPMHRTNKTINVAAVNSDYKAAHFSNYNAGSNISAPGTAIKSSLPGNKYGNNDGTSMATPMVAGTVALMKSCNPDLTVEQVLDILQKTGLPISNDIPPMIQVDAALRLVVGYENPEGSDSEGGNDDDYGDIRRQIRYLEDQIRNLEDQIRNLEDRKRELKKRLPENNK